MIFNHFQVCDYNENNCELFQFEESVTPFQNLSDPVALPPIQVSSALCNECNTGSLEPFANGTDLFEDTSFSSLSQPKQTPISISEQSSEDLTESEILLRKSKFTPQEDEILKDLVSKHGRNWALIAKMIPNKERKQVRERFENFLAKKLSRKSFTAEEDCKILELIEKMGTKFYKIAEQLEGRTAIMVKNRYYSKLLKQKLVH
jgi:hypothetical protein